MSRPYRARILLVLAFVLTLVAGMVVGAGLARQAWAGGDGPAKHPVPEQTTKGRHPEQGNWLTQQLDLTEAQRAQVD